MRRVVGILCGVAIVGAGAAVAMANRSTGEIPEPSREPDVVTTTTATLSCPESPRTEQTQTNLLAVTPASADPASTGDGSGEVTVLSKSESKPLGQLTAPGTPASVELTPADRPATLVQASGDLAPGVAAAQWSTQRKNAGNGLSASLCQSAADEWNFGAVSTAVGATTRLVVTNPTPAVAVFDLTFFGPDGQVDAIGARGIALAPQSRESYDLAQFAPGVEAMAMNLTVDSGRVVAAVHTDLIEGNDATGSEWIAPGLPPATELLVNPGFASGTEQELQIANPTGREALVQVQLVSKNGPFAPTKLKDLQVDPFSVVTEDLSDLLDKEASAVHVTSTTPVTAAVLDRSGQAKDLAVSSATPPVDGPAVVPLIEDADLTIALSSEERAGGAVRITGYSDDGSEVGDATIDFKGFRTKTWEPSKKLVKRATYLVVTLPKPIELHAVAQYDSADGLTSLPVESGTFTLSRPDVAPAR